MKKDKVTFVIMLIVYFLIILILIYNNKITKKYLIRDGIKVGITDTISVYGDSIGWYNKNRTHVFFKNGSKIDTLK